MSSIHSSNRNTITHLSSSTQILRSTSDLARLVLRRSHPRSLEFRLEDSTVINNASFKKLTNFLTKSTLKLKNPPIKETSNTGSITRHLRSLQVRPEDASRYITQITRRFSKVKHLVIVDEQDSFLPLRVKKKVHPMRNLKTFTYDHEFCREFMRCARYTSELNIRKISMNLRELKRFQRLERLHLILRTKYLSLPEEDMRFTKELGDTLSKLPLIKNITLEQEIDPENNPYTFLELSKMLKDKVTVSLVADFIDVSNQKHKDLAMEKMMDKIHEFGIENLKVKYAGVIKVVKRFERVFHAPIHTREEIYSRFINTILDPKFKKVSFMPSIHSSHIDLQLKNSLLELCKPNRVVQVPGLSLIYNLDMIEFGSLELMKEIFDSKISCCEITIINTCDMRKGLAEKLEEHYSSVFSKIKEAGTRLSVQIVARNLKILSTIFTIILTKLDSEVLQNFNIHLTDPLNKEGLQNFSELLKNPSVRKVIRQVEIDLSQKESPSAGVLYDFVTKATQGWAKLNKFTLSYRTRNECDQVFQRVFEKLRHERPRIDFSYEISDESGFEE